MIKGRGDQGARASADEAIKPYVVADLRLAHDDADVSWLKPAASPKLGAQA
jgi:hypothetical protein